jgi:K+-transporting ATPase ATPase A chain
MSPVNLLQDTLFLAVVLLLVKPLGAFMARVFTGGKTLLDPILCPVECLVYRAGGVDPEQEMDWKQYALSLVWFTLAGTVLLYAILREQAFLPWFHKAYITTPMTPDLAFNTALSFTTTTTWQAYAGESTMSYFTQVVGLAGQNFLAGAAGLAVGVAFIRGLANVKRPRLGNFWVDLTRAMLWVLLPASVVGSLVLVWQGVPMNFAPYTHITTVEGVNQTVTQGPVAALEWIKNLGTNGGGFFNVNGAHPFENPTPLTNFLEMLAIVVLPAALTHTFGALIGRPRQGWTLFWVMAFLFVVGLAACGHYEQAGNPLLASAGLMPGGGNMEGKETRFGIGASVLTAVVTSNGATGSTNSMHDSYTPLGGMVPMVDMLLGEIVFGGLGTGLYSIILVALIGLFIAGLMVGRSPEYLGKQLGPAELKLIMLYTLAAPVAILLPTALAVGTAPGLAALTTNSGPHGFSELLYAYTSSFANNGQSFGGISADTPFYNVTTAFALMLGRFGLAIPALALAGRFAAQGRRPVSVGTLPTDSFQFSGLLVGTAVIVVGLTFLPALALGPLVEHLMLPR